MPPKKKQQQRPLRMLAPKGGALPMPLKENKRKHNPEVDEVIALYKAALINHEQKTETYETTRTAYENAKSGATPASEDELKKLEREQKEAKDALQQAQEEINKIRLIYRPVVINGIKALEERPWDDPDGSELADLRKRKDELAKYVFDPEKIIRELEAALTQRSNISLDDHGKRKNTEQEKDIRRDQLYLEYLKEELAAKEALLGLKIERESSMRQDNENPNDETKKELKDKKEEIATAQTKYNEAQKKTGSVNGTYAKRQWGKHHGQSPTGGQQGQSSTNTIDPKPKPGKPSTRHESIKPGSQLVPQGRREQGRKKRPAPDSDKEPDEDSEDKFIDSEVESTDSAGGYSDLEDLAARYGG